MLIAIDGLDGAGKSTHAGLLQEWLSQQGISCEVTSKWDGLQAHRHPASRFLRGTDRRELTACASEMPMPARSLLILWFYAMAAAHAASLAADRLVILDGFWMKHAAMELIYGCDRRLIESAVAAMPAADEVFYLDVAPAQALRRKLGTLTPYECGLDRNLDPARFVSVQRQSRAMLLEWAQRDGWHIIPAGTVGQVQSMLKAKVQACIARAAVLANG